jgi:hypothetical protein
MNFLALEQKFQLVDRRESEMRSFFDPKTLAGKKHKFIKDLKADYDFDNLIYGLGKYVSDAPIKPRPQHLEMKVEDTPKVPSIPPSPQLKGFKARLRNPSALHIMQPLAKELYEGIFCNTRIVKPEILNAKKELELRGEEGKEVWVSREKGSPERNRAAGEEVRLAFPRIGRRRVHVQGETEGSEELKASFSPPRHHSTLHSSFPSDSPFPALPRLPPILKAQPLPPPERTAQPSTPPVPSADVLVLKCTKQIQSPFSDNPLVYFETSLPRISIQLLEDVHRNSNQQYALQLTDLSVTGYPLTQIEALYCDCLSDWVRLPSGDMEIDFKSLIKDYKSVQSHTVRLVLVALGERRRLIERLFFFGPNDPHGEAKIILDLDRFRAYLTAQIRPKPSVSFSPHPKRSSHAGSSTFHSLLAKVQQAKEAREPVRWKDLKETEIDTMKIITPRKMLGEDESVAIEEGEQEGKEAKEGRDRQDYKHPVTKGMLSYRNEDLMYKHDLYAANLVYLEDQIKYKRAVQSQARELAQSPSPELDMRITGLSAYPSS